MNPSDVQELRKTDSPQRKPEAAYAEASSAVAEVKALIQHFSPDSPEVRAAACKAENKVRVAGYFIDAEIDRAIEAVTSEDLDAMPFLRRLGRSKRPSSAAVYARRHDGETAYIFSRQIATGRALASRREMGPGGGPGLLFSGHGHATARRELADVSEYFPRAWFAPENKDRALTLVVKSSESGSHAECTTWPFGDDRHIFSTDSGEVGLDEFVSGDNGYDPEKMQIYFYEFVQARDCGRTKEMPARARVVSTAASGKYAIWTIGRDTTYDGTKLRSLIRIRAARSNYLAQVRCTATHELTHRFQSTNEHLATIGREFLVRRCRGSRVEMYDTGSPGDGFRDGGFVDKHVGEVDSNGGFRHEALAIGAAAVLSGHCGGLVGHDSSLMVRRDAPANNWFRNWRDDDHRHFTLGMLAFA